MQWTVLWHFWQGNTPRQRKDTEQKLESFPVPEHQSLLIAISLVYPNQKKKKWKKNKQTNKLLSSGKLTTPMPLPAKHAVLLLHCTDMTDFYWFPITQTQKTSNMHASLHYNDGLITRNTNPQNNNTDRKGKHIHLSPQIFCALITNCKKLLVLNYIFSTLMI